jgi:hypothetical protein
MAAREMAHVRESTNDSVTNLRNETCHLYWHFSDLDVHQLSPWVPGSRLYRERLRPRELSSAKNTDQPNEDLVNGYDIVQDSRHLLH